MRRVFLSVLVPFVLLFISGCGGGGGSGDAPVAAAPDVVLIGKLAVATMSSRVGPVVQVAAGDPIVVSVQGTPSISTTVASDGTFTLRGLPAGGFTLVFMQGADPLGTMIFTEVAVNQQITITIQVVGGEVILVDEDRRGIGNAGVELEGLVENVVTLNALGDSRFVIAGRSVVARPGVTAIRKGTTRLSVDDVKFGVRVHVKGTTVADSTDVLAFEIIIQDTTTPTGPTTEEKITICHIPPGKPDNKQTISIGVSAWPAHEAHGDHKGAC
jgi:hypothetical protein